VHNEKLESVRNGARQLGSVLNWRLAPIIGLPMLVSALLLSPTSDSENKALQRADIALYSGDIELAELTYNEVIDQWPSSFEAGLAHAHLAEIAESDGDTLRAIEHYLAAIRLSPDSDDTATWMVNTGQALVLTGDTPHAREIWLEASSRFPESPAMFSLANNLLASGDPSEAFEYFQTMASSVGPYSELGQLGLSICYERLGEMESAVAELDDDVWVERRERLISRATASRR